MKKNLFSGAKGRIAAVGALTVCTVAAAAAAYSLGIDPPAVNVAGAFAIIAAVLILMRFVKVPDGLFYTGLLFIFFASPMGSIVDLYRIWGPYDKIVHLASGVLLAAAGCALCCRLFNRVEKDIVGGSCVAGEDRAVGTSGRGPVLEIIILFAFLTASAGAGLWEIFEFAADKVAGGGMQRGMVDTLTDMIAGNLGGLGYCGYIYLRERR